MPRSAAIVSRYTVSHGEPGQASRIRSVATFVAVRNWTSGGDGSTAAFSRRPDPSMMSSGTWLPPEPASDSGPVDGAGPDGPAGTDAAGADGAGLAAPPPTVPRQAAGWTGPAKWRRSTRSNEVASPAEQSSRAIEIDLSFSSTSTMALRSQGGPLQVTSIAFGSAAGS